MSGFLSLNTFGHRPVCCAPLTLMYILRIVCVVLLESLVRPYLNTLLDIVDIKPANMEELTEVITAAEFHPHQCNTFVYSSSKGTIRMCDMRASALCDKHSKRESPPERVTHVILNDSHHKPLI